MVKVVGGECQRELKVSGELIPELFGVAGSPEDTVTTTFTGPSLDDHPGRDILLWNLHSFSRNTLKVRYIHNAANQEIRHTSVDHVFIQECPSNN